MSRRCLSSIFSPTALVQSQRYVTEICVCVSSVWGGTGVVSETTLTSVQGESAVTTGFSLADC